MRRPTAPRSSRATSPARLLRPDLAELLRPERLAQARLTTDARNRLRYELEAADGRDGRAGPHALVLDGAWRLDARHDLTLLLRHSRRQDTQRLTLRGALLEARAHALTFALEQAQDDGDRSTSQRLALSGRWAADARNRLVFLAQRADGAEDRLTLQGGWELGEHHQLLYRYRRLAGRRTRQERTLLFEGAWDLTAADRLTYRLAGSDTSAFEFRASLRTPSLIAREGRIVYEVGIGLSQGRLKRRRVELFGTWKLHQDLSVSFEMPVADGRVQALRFEGSASLGPRNRIAVALRNSRREPLGLSVVFTRQLVRDADVFLRLRQEAEERSVVGGVRVRF